MLMQELFSQSEPAVCRAVADPMDDLPIAYAELNAEGVVTRCNRAARLLHSLDAPDASDAGEMVGRHAWDFTPGDQAEADRRAFLDMIHSGVEPPVIRRSLYSGGEFRTYELHRTLMRDGNGAVIGVRAATFDVTETEIAQEATRRAKLWLESVLDSMSEAIVITDSLGFIRTVNPAAEALFGWKAGDLTGKVIEKALPLLQYVSENKEKLNFNMALQTRSRGIASILDRERNPVLVELSTSPILDKSTGYTSGVVSVMQPIKEICRLDTPQPSGLRV